MSNEVYGFIDFISPPNTPQEICSEIVSRTGLGCFEISDSELYGFPPSTCPSRTSFVFLITDNPNSKNATYLVDYLDYSDEARIGMPLRGKDRIKMLVRVIDLLFEMHSILRVAIAITDSSQIEEIKEVKHQSMYDVLVSDCEKLAPPSILYLVV